MAGSGGRELKAPAFNGENFDFLQIKMKTIFRSHDLWDLVENGYKTPTKEEEELTEAERKLMSGKVVKDARALGIIQGAVLDQIFSRIATQETAKAVWDILKQEFVAVIKNRKDLDTIDAQDVVAILKGYEQRLDRHGDNSAEKAFASLNVGSKSARSNGHTSKSQKNVKPQGQQWGNKGDGGNKTYPFMKNEIDNTGNKCKFCDKLHYGECWLKNKVKCHKCNKIGHIARYCHTNKAVQQVNFANQVEEPGNLFYANHSGEDRRRIGDEWCIDSGCSNHMTSRADLLLDIDKRVKATVQVGTGALVDVARKGTSVIDTMTGR
ncbi:uncharacterized protein LOC109948068 [Prunus persica]|uniref:uncharacterized protein LOC109948068 n=1 Tax=Prunus persica TaxID=3760 RepID=UPI0009AB6C0C|nr:uncharacterized protein LOC109948068 [Prunus persica]